MSHQLPVGSPQAEGKTHLALQQLVFRSTQPLNLEVRHRKRPCTAFILLTSPVAVLFSMGLFRPPSALFACVDVFCHRGHVRPGTGVPGMMDVADAEICPMLPLICPQPGLLLAPFLPWPAQIEMQLRKFLNFQLWPGSAGVLESHLGEGKLGWRKCRMTFPLLTCTTPIFKKTQPKNNWKQRLKTVLQLWIRVISSSREDRRIVLQVSRCTVKSPWVSAVLWLQPQTHTLAPARTSHSPKGKSCLPLILGNQGKVA